MREKLDKGEVRSFKSSNLFIVAILGKGKLTLPFSAEHLWISAPLSPTRWLYPLKPGGEQKSADVWQKMVTLIYLDPILVVSLKIL
jgi:hypothetical protein